MKSIKNIIISFIAIVIAINFTLFSNTIVFAHSSILNVVYDDCVDERFKDGIDEMWYVLNDNSSCHHLSNNVLTIKYYFEETSKDGIYTWTTDVSDIVAQEIKEAYVDSMKKWNNVYYYTYDDYGNREPNKIINIEEGTASDHNLTIYPGNRTGSIASTNITGGIFDMDIMEIGMVTHTHYAKWEMVVNIDYFYEHGSHTMGRVNAIREITGAHELGHILGLRDIDSSNLCNSDTTVPHHMELLMGYGSGATNRALNITYKDIAGVSITRGFHTDEDHAWMIRTNDDGTQDVICAQCNGVRYDVTLTDGKYEGKNVNIYQSCVHHGGTNQEMLLVATDGERDFFKCQYCRKIITLDLSNTTTIDKYVQTNISKSVASNNSHYQRLIIDKSGIHTFKAVELENLSITLCDDNLNDTGLITDSVFTSSGSSGYLSKGTYYLKIENSASNSQTLNISVTPPPHTHNYTEYAKYSATHHIQACECGATGTVTSPHVVKSAEAGNRLANCMLCGQLILLDNTIVQVPGLNSITQVTSNGSYILPNGIIVLVDADIEAYLNGTLVFYDKDDLPVVQ